MKSLLGDGLGEISNGECWLVPAYGEACAGPEASEVLRTYVPDMTALSASERCGLRVPRDREDNI